MQPPQPIPVGITIAYKKQAGGILREKPISNKSTKQTKGTQLQVFIDSALIYAVCLILPSILGYAYQCYVLLRQNNSIAKPDQWTQLSDILLCDQSDSYFWSSVTSMSHYMGWCPPPQEMEIYSNDIFAWSDSFSITVFSIVITILRIMIVHWYVPLEDAQELETMVRCKSMHLLSSDYVVTPVGTPVRPRRLISTTGTTTLGVPNLEQPDGSSSAPPSVHLETIGTGEPNTGETKEDNFGDFDDDQLMAKLAAASDEGDKQQASSRMYAGPRYATALFRLFYSASAVVIALVFFRTADFWPWYVFGRGDSSQCWDLSGGLAMAMDSDFDQRNIYLKQYFLWQASYHWHSAAFHILSMLILTLHPTKHAPQRFLSLQKGTTIYIRRLFQHSLAVALIGIAYVFSSLRRLGAIGLFAFDVSSCCLHFLQLCMNAPEGSRLSQSTTIAVVFWVFVVPTFILARFAVWPAIWYSAAYESSAWLLQLEKTLWPGSAAMIRYAIHFLMAALEILSVVYFQRLFNHAHVKRMLSLGCKSPASSDTPRKQLFTAQDS